MNCMLRQLHSQAVWTYAGRILTAAVQAHPFSNIAGGSSNSIKAGSGDGHGRATGGLEYVNPVGADGLIAGGVLAELRSFIRFLLPTRYKALYYPTPKPIANTMLRLASVGPDDVVFDLGCGDGRIVIAAAQPPFTAKRCVGVELDPRLAKLSRQAVSIAGLSDRITIIEGDAAAADVSDATVLALYLSDTGNRDLLQAVRPTLRPGTRVVSHYFPVAGWEAALLRRDTSAGINIYLYRVP